MAVQRLPSGRWAALRARELAGPQPTLRADASAAEAALVSDAQERFVGVVSDEDLLRTLLAGYIGYAEALARVLEEGTAGQLWRRLETRTLRDLMTQDRPEEPVVEGDATLVEVASVMVRADVRLVAVVEEGRLIGGVTMDHLLSHLIPRR
jgi:CBS domain-containing protein